MSMNCVEDAFASSSRGLEASHARVLVSIASSSTLQSNLLSSDLIYHIGIRPQLIVLGATVRLHRMEQVRRKKRQRKAKQTALYRVYHRSIVHLSCSVT